MNTRSRFILAVVALCVLCAPHSGYGEPSKPPSLTKPDLSKLAAYPVVRVVDGDTIVVKLGAKDTAVRLIGVDTPETVHPQKPVEAYGKEASRFTTNLLKGEKVYLVSDPQGDKVDRYGRMLAYVYRAPDGLFVNAEIIRQGYGHAYTRFPFKYLEQFRKLETFARQAKKGLWASAAVPVLKPKPDADSMTVYVTRSGKKYHRGGCRYLRRSRIQMKLSEARKRYGPCSVCGPAK